MNKSVIITEHICYLYEPRDKKLLTNVDDTTQIVDELDGNNCLAKLS